MNKQIVDVRNSAKFYDCRDSEQLSLGTEEEAVEEWLEFWMTPGVDVVALIAKQAPVTVRGYDPEVIDVDREAKSMAESLIERAIEYFDENFGNPDGDTEIAEGAEKVAEEAVRAALVTLYGNMHVWRCEEVSKRVLNATEDRGYDAGASA